MSQFYLNRPSVGRAISAEEFAGAAGRPFADCSGTAQSPDCCCCGGGKAPVRPAPPVNGDCCCCCEPCKPVRPAPPAGSGSDCCCCCCEPCKPIQPTPPAGGGSDCCCCCCEPCKPVRPAPPAGGGSDCCCCCCEPCKPVRPAPPADGGCDCCCCCCCCEPCEPVRPAPPADGGCDCCCCCCCCQPAHTPPPQVNEGCCCKQSFRAALGLLCDQQISRLLDFDAAAFITNTYTAGATLTGGKPHAAGAAGSAPEADAAGCAAMAAGKPTPPPHCCPSGASDNLGTLSGSFRRFSPCTCDLLDIEAELYTAGGKSCAFTAAQVSLCELDAVVIQAAKACPEGELSGETVTDRNFRCLTARLAQRLNPCGDSCGQNWCSCACDSRDCCCAAGLLATLAQNNLSRRVSLAAGLLVLNDVALLGTVGNVLVLANDADNRLYFVCVNSVQFIG